MTLCGKAQGFGEHSLNATTSSDRIMICKDIIIINERRDCAVTRMMTGAFDSRRLRLGPGLKIHYYKYEFSHGIPAGRYSSTGGALACMMQPQNES